MQSNVKPHLACMRTRLKHYTIVHYHTTTMRNIYAQTHAHASTHARQLATWTRAAAPAACQHACVCVCEYALKKSKDVKLSNYNWILIKYNTQSPPLCHSRSMRSRARVNVAFVRSFSCTSIIFPVRSYTLGVYTLRLRACKAIYVSVCMHAFCAHSRRTSAII